MAYVFDGLSDVVATEEAHLSGGWVGKSQRRYASPDQAHNGEGPFIDVVDWRWEGEPQVLVQVKGVAFAVMLLPASSVKVGRNRLWCLRERLAARLRPELRGLLTTGRSGRIATR